MSPLLKAVDANGAIIGGAVETVCNRRLIAQHAAVAMLTKDVVHPSVDRVVNGAGAKIQFQRDRSFEDDDVKLNVAHVVA